MLDCAVCALPPAATTEVGPMSLLGPDYPARLLDMEGHQWGHQCLTPYPPPLLPAFPSLWAGSRPPPLLVVPPSLLPQCGAECCDVGRVARRGVGHLVDCYLQSSRMTAPHCFCCKGDALRLGHCVEPNGEEEGVSVGGKDLPSRTLRAERVKERQELGQVMGMDRQHLLALQHARKTTTISTQTQYSSFKGEAPPYPGPPTGPPPAYFAPHDSYHGVHHGYRPPPLPPAPLTSPLSSPLSSSSPPASNHLVDLSRTSQQSSSDVQNAPLNLSLSNGSNGVSSSSSSSSERPSAQPSVITCLSSSASSSSSRESSPGGRVKGGGGTVNGRGSPAACSPPVSDPAIEEHFRRSLGRSYRDSRPKTVPSTTAVANPANVSVTESVDDHFAKALGDSTWKAIQSQNDDAVMDVWDDHFAKALGATTWRRIKAETEHSENVNNNNGSSNGYSPSRPSPTSPPASSLSATVAS